MKGGHDLVDRPGGDDTRPVVFPLSFTRETGGNVRETIKSQHPCPPSVREFLQRLVARGQLDPDVAAMRMGDAPAAYKRRVDAVRSPRPLKCAVLPFEPRSQRSPSGRVSSTPAPIPKR